MEPGAPFEPSLAGKTPSAVARVREESRLSSSRNLPVLMSGPVYMGPGRDHVMDTGVRLSVRGDLALCTSQGYELLGLVCEKCGRITASIRPWTRCGNCGESFMDVRQTNRPSCALTVDWATGFTSKEVCPPDVSTPPHEFTVKQMDYVRARARGSRFRSGGDICAPPGGLVAFRPGEPSVVGSVRVSVPEEKSSSSDVLGEEEYFEAAAVEPKEKGGVVDEWEYMREALPKPESEHAAQKSDHGVFKPDKAVTSVKGVKAKEKGPRMENVYGTPRPDDSPPRTAARAYAETMAHNRFVCRAKDSYLQPGTGNPVALPKLSRFQWFLNKRVAREYGYEYPYVPEHVMDEIEANRKLWEEEDVWNYLGVPKPCRDINLSPVFADKFYSCMATWSHGRYIYKDKVLIKSPHRPDAKFSYPAVNDYGEQVEIPDPKWYF